MEPAPLAAAAAALLAFAAVPQDDPLQALSPPSRALGEHQHPLTHLALSPDGAILVAADAQGGVAAFRLKDERRLWLHDGHAPPGGVDVGEELVATGISGAAAVGFLLLEDGSERTGVGGPAPGGATAVVCDPKDRWVWIGTDQGSLLRINPGDVNSWSRRRVGNGAVRCMADDERGKVLAIGGADGTVRFVDPSSANVDDKKVLEGHAGPVTALALDRKGTLVVSGSEDRSVRLWKVASGKQLELLGEHDAPIRSLAFDPRGRWAASGDEDGGLRLWDTKKRRPLGAVELEGSGAVSALCALDGGKLLAAARGDQLVLLDMSDL